MATQKSALSGIRTGNIFEEIKKPPTYDPYKPRAVSSEKMFVTPEEAVRRWISGGGGGGGGGTPEQPTGISDYEKRLQEELFKAEERRKIDAERQRQIEQAKEIEDERQRNIKIARINIEASNKARMYASTDVGKTLVRSEQARELRGLAREKGIGISTPAGEMKFLQEVQAGKYEEPTSTTTGTGETFYYMDTPSGRVSISKEEYNKRQKEYEDYQKYKQTPLGKLETKYEGVKTKYYEPANIWVKKHVTEPFIFKPLEKVGVTKENIGKIQKIPTDFSLLPGMDKAMAEFRSGMVEGIYEDIREEPVKQGVLFGIGGALGFVTKGVVTGAGAISPRLGTATKWTTTGVGVGLTGLYGVSVAKDIAVSPDIKTAGEIFGVNVKDLGLIGYGFGKGEKGFQKVTGYVRTRGRELIPAEDLIPEDVLSGEKTFPTAPPSKHYDIFIESPSGNKLREEPGAFHATGEKFWKTTKTGEIIPDVGTSELPGLYGSAYISPHFTRVTGQGTEYKLFGLIEGGLPGVAYLKPKGFRITDFSLSKIKQFEKQRSVRGKYAYWKEPVKEGYADIPKMKTEIEAVFRPESGTYSFESGKYYTKIKGVRIPIDVFGYKGEEMIGKVVDIDGVKLTGGASSYYLPGKTSLLKPESLSVGLSKSYTKSTSKIYSEPKLSYAKSSYKPSSYSKVSSSIVSYEPKSSYKKPSSYKPATSYKPSSKISDVARYEPLRYSYKRSYKRPPPSVIREDYYYRSQIPKRQPILVSSKKRRGKIGKYSDLGIEGFDLYLIKGKKPSLVRRGLTKTSALDLGTSEVLKDLSATFFLKPSSYGARDLDIPSYFSKYRGALRKPRPKSRYTGMGTDIYIQKQTGLGRIYTRGEKKAIREAQFLKNDFNINLFGRKKKRRR